MKRQCTLRELLQIAIQKEIESQLLYTDLCSLVSHPAAKDAFQELTEQELGHQKLLEQYLRGEFSKVSEGALDNGYTLDYEIAERFNQPQISISMELKETFLLAANREKLSHEFYLSLAAIHPDGKAKNLLKKLARQELGHKQRVEFLYTEVAFPQTDGG